MERKRIDFNTPLLSVRRFHSSIASSATEAAESRIDGDRSKEKKKTSGAGDDRREKRSMLPFYKADLKSGPVRNPGVVPFVWEQSPGHPKADDSTVNSVDHRPKVLVKSSDRMSLHVSGGVVKKDSVSDCRRDGDVDGSVDDDGESFLDAVETLSRTESCSMNCSVSEMSRMGEPAASGSCFKTDPQVRDFMMGRFLPAARALVTESPKVTLRKPNSSTQQPRVERGAHRRPVLLPHQTQPKNITKYPHFNQTQLVDCSDDQDDDDDDEAFDDHHTRHMVMKGCGFLLPKFCLKSSLSFMNHAPNVGNKNRATAASLPSDQRFPPPTKAKENQGRPVAKIRYETWEAMLRHRLGHGTQPMQEEEKESKLITNSQSSAESSQSHRSSFGEGKGFLGLPVVSDKIGKAESSKFISGSLSPAVEKTLYVDSACMPPETSVNINFQLNSVEKDNEVTEESEIMEVKYVEVPEIVSNDKSNPRGKIEIDEKESKVQASIDSSVTTDFSDCCSIDDSLQFIHPPLPSTPSESWLQRTLPSISSKNQSPQTFLGMQLINSKNEITHLSSSADPLLKNIVKTSVVRSAVHSRFSEHENKD